jgi:hypothetical protein
MQQEVAYDASDTWKFDGNPERQHRTGRRHSRNSIMNQVLKKAAILPTAHTNSTELNKKPFTSTLIQRNVHVHTK